MRAEKSGPPFARKRVRDEKMGGRGLGFAKWKPFGSGIDLSKHAREVKGLFTKPGSAEIRSVFPGA
jgi:hypothetical protein